MQQGICNEGQFSCTMRSYRGGNIHFLKVRIPERSVPPLTGELDVSLFYDLQTTTSNTYLGGNECIRVRRIGHTIKLKLCIGDVPLEFFSTEARCFLEFLEDQGLCSGSSNINDEM